MISCETDSRHSSHCGRPVLWWATAVAASSGERHRPRFLPTNWTPQPCPVFASRTVPAEVGCSNAISAPTMDAALQNCAQSRSLSSRLLGRRAVPVITPTRGSPVCRLLRREQPANHIDQRAIHGSASRRPPAWGNPCPPASGCADWLGALLAQHYAEAGQTDSQ